MLQALPDRSNLKITGVYEYPCYDLMKYREMLLTPLEQIRMVFDVLTALKLLHHNNLYHGDVRPELVFFNSEQYAYVLIDTMTFSDDPAAVQRANLQAGKDVYMHPELFDALMQDRKAEVSAAQNDLF